MGEEWSQSRWLQKKPVGTQPPTPVAGSRDLRNQDWQGDPVTYTAEMRTQLRLASGCGLRERGLLFSVTTEAAPDSSLLSLRDLPL